jgi:hypothetical protein
MSYEQDIHVIGKEREEERRGREREITERAHVRARERERGRDQRERERERADRTRVNTDYDIALFDDHVRGADLPRSVMPTPLVPPRVCRRGKKLEGLVVRPLLPCCVVMPTLHANSVCV